MKDHYLDKFVAYFRKFSPLSDNEELAIRKNTSIRTFEKGTVLLEQGQIAQECYFVLEGCVRQWRIEDGTEKTTFFYTEEQWVDSFESNINQVPSEYYFSCVEESVLVLGNQDKGDELLKQFPNFETIYRKILEKDLSHQQQMMASYITDSPEQRYLKLLENRPELIQRVPQYQLASYLGVQPESLSRIKKRIVQKNGIPAK